MKMITVPEIRNKLKEMASDAGSIAELARQAGVTRQYLSDVIAGHRGPGPGILSFLNLRSETVIKRAER